MPSKAGIQLSRGDISVAASVEDGETGAFEYYSGHRDDTQRYICVSQTSQKMS